MRYKGLKQRNSTVKTTITLILCLIVTNLSAQQSNNTNTETANVKTVYDLTLQAAQKLTNYGLKLAEERKLNIAIAVTDRSGSLLAFVRMDNASMVTVEVATGKAKSAAYLKSPSKNFEDYINSGKPSMATTPGILPLQGGVPITYDGEVIGAVGVSGASGDVDNEIATLIAKYLN